MFGWLQPGETFVIPYQISQLLDSATYYVQAVVRNLNTGATLATVNLSLVANQRYEGSLVVPSDPPGTGTWISITTTVYEDAGYSVPSANYGARLDTYLVMDRTRAALGYGARGGGSFYVDYDHIGKLVEGAVKKIRKEDPGKDAQLEEIAETLATLTAAVTRQSELIESSDAAAAQRSDAARAEMLAQFREAMKLVVEQTKELSKMAQEVRAGMRESATLQREINRLATFLSATLSEIRRMGETLSSQVASLSAVSRAIKLLAKEVGGDISAQVASAVRKAMKVKFTFSGEPDDSLRAAGAPRPFPTETRRRFTLRDLISSPPHEDA